MSILDSPIVMAAHVVICPDCRRHGHIVFADGTTSGEFCCRTAASQAVSRAVQQELLVAEEQAVIEQEVIDASLPSLMTFHQMVICENAFCTTFQAMLRSAEDEVMFARN